jgi:membrane protein YfhO
METPGKAARNLVVTLAMLVVVFGMAHPGVLVGKVLFPGDILFGLAGWRDVAPEGFRGPANAILSDPVFQYYPWRIAATEMMKRGEPPLWNRWNGLGSPLLANFQSSLFDPTAIGFFVLPPAHAWTLQFFLRFLIAGMLAYLLAVHLGAGVVGSRLAAVSYALAGTVGATAHWPTATGAAWFPGLVLVADLLASSRSARHVALLAAVMAACVASSHPETLLVVQMTTFAWFLVRARVFSRRSTWIERLAHLGRYAAAGTIALMITAPLLLPFAKYLPKTYRYQVFHRSHSAASSCYPLVSLLSFFEPGFFGGPVRYWGKLNLVAMHALFSGATALLLASTAFVRTRTRRTATTWAVLSAAGVLIAFRGPVHSLAAKLPLFDVAALDHFSAVPNLGISLLGAFGLRAIRQRSGAPRRVLAWSAILLFAVPAAYLAVFWRNLHSIRHLDETVFVVLTFAATTAAVVGLSATTWRKKDVGILAIAVGELVWAKRGYEPCIPAGDVYPPTAWSRVLRHDLDARTSAGEGPFRVLGLPEDDSRGITGVIANALAPYGLEDPGVSDPMFPDEYRWLVEMTSPTGPMVYLRPGVARPKLLDLMGVRYLLSPKANGARSLASLLEGGLRTGSADDAPEASTLEVDGRGQAVILAGAPSSVEATLPRSSRGRRFSFRLGVDATSIRGDGDALDCIVEAAEERPSRLVMSTYIDPRRSADGPHWKENEIDLSEFAGRRVALTLRVTAGPDGSEAFDSAAWASLRVGETTLSPDELAAGLRHVGGDDYIRTASVVLDGDARDALVMHPDSEVETTVDVPADPREATLEAALWIAPDGGDGVLFEVLARAAPEWREVYRRGLDSASNGEVPRWIQGSADLSAFGNGPVRLRLRTTCPSNGVCAARVAWAALDLDPPLETDLGEFGGLHVVRRDTALPRARIYHDWVADDSAPETRARLISGSTDFDRTAFIDGAVSEERSDLEDAANDSVRISRYDDQIVVVDASADSPGYLVLFDSFATGWEATVDGVSEAIQRADRCFRAVRLDAGRHQVVFRYRPMSFRVGLWLASFGALAFAALPLAALLRRRSSPAATPEPRGRRARARDPEGARRLRVKEWTVGRSRPD